MPYIKAQLSKVFYQYDVTLIILCTNITCTTKDIQSSVLLHKRPVFRLHKLGYDFCN